MRKINFNGLVDRLPGFIGKLVHFYIDPYQETAGEGILIKKPKFSFNFIKRKRNNKKEENSLFVEAKKSKLVHSSILEQLKDYYGKKFYLILSTLGAVLVVASIASIYYTNYMWLWFYLFFIFSFSAFYFGIHFIFQRKRDIIDGFIRFITGYIVSRSIVTFKGFVIDAKPSDYPKEFGKELINMKLLLNTKESMVVITQFFEDPKNSYPELQTFKTLTLGFVSTQDESIARALGNYLTYVDTSKKTLISKLNFIKIFPYVSLAFMFGIPAILMEQFKASFASESGILAKINITPTPLHYLFFLVFGSLAISIISAAIYMGTYDEGKAIKNGYLMMLALFVVSYIMFSFAL